MAETKDAKSLVLETLKKAELDLSVPEVCEKTGLNRHTVSKWLEVLKAEKKIEETRKVGWARFYRVK